MVCPSSGRAQMIRHSSKVMTEGRWALSQAAAFDRNGSISRPVPGPTGGWRFLGAGRAVPAGPKSRHRKTANAATAIAAGSTVAFRAGGWLAPRSGEVLGRCVDAGKWSFRRCTRCVRAERVRQERAVLKRHALGRPDRRVPGIDIPLERERYGCRRPFRGCRGLCAGNAGGEGKWCEVRSISG